MGRWRYPGNGRTWRYVPTSGIAENTGGGQRNTGIGYGEGGTQTPRTGDNDCDVGTYRQVRPTFLKRADLMTGTTVPIKEECRKTRRKEKTCVSGRLHFDWADGGIQATDAPNRYVPTSASRETAAGSQRNAGIGYGEGGTQTPRTGDNDCDVGTYRQVRPTFLNGRIL